MLGIVIRLRAKREVWRAPIDVVNVAPQEKERFFSDLRERRCGFSGEACLAPGRRKRQPTGSRRGCGRDPPSPLPRRVTVGAALRAPASHSPLPKTNGAIAHHACRSWYERPPQSHGTLTAESNAGVPLVPVILPITALPARDPVEALH